MIHVFKNLFGVTAKSRQRRRTISNLCHPRAGLESLESRQLLSATVMAGDLVITGTDPTPVKYGYVQQGGNDNVTVSFENGFYKVTENGQHQFFHSSLVYGGDVVFYGKGGNDVFRNNTDLRTWAYGGYGDDTLYGGSNTDRLYGGAGNDYLDGGLGNDYLYGEFGDDHLEGGYGIDQMYGGDGNDWMDGGFGTDYMYGENGHDRMIAGFDFSANYMYGGDGNDSMYGGSGFDYMDAGFGDDYLFGNAGNDYLYGGPGMDYLYGGDGDDDLDGGNYGERDELYGGAGRDRFRRERVELHWYNSYVAPGTSGPGGWNIIHDLEAGEEIYD